MNVGITVPDALEARFRKAVKDRYADLDPDDTMTPKQLADAATALHWRAVLVEYEEREAEREAQRANHAAIRAARAKAETDAAGIG